MTEDSSTTTATALLTTTTMSAPAITTTTVITAATVEATVLTTTIPTVKQQQQQQSANNNNSGANGIDRVLTTTTTITTDCNRESNLNNNRNSNENGINEMMTTLRLGNNNNNGNDNNNLEQQQNCYPTLMSQFAMKNILGNANNNNGVNNNINNNSNGNNGFRLYDQCSAATVTTSADYCKSRVGSYSAAIGTSGPVPMTGSELPGLDPAAVMMGLPAVPGSWYHEGLGGGGDESSGFYSGSGFSGSGSAAASCGAPADCSPPLSSCHGMIDANFDDEFDQQLMKTTDPNLPGSKNVTESVEVPSSEHVAEIVGRQGCKIKALRAKTNTYIKTPVRGEDPVFVVTGRLEDVQEAKREIQCAAEHFTQIRASRRHSQGGVPAPGHITAYVRVPLRVVGLVVGPKGATIKRIQQDTHTYIITPSREREPIFEVTGLVQNVNMARREIEQHIFQRTGNMPITDPSASISHFDVASQVAAHAATANHPNRPNYGALAAATATAASAAAAGENPFADYQTKQQQQQHWQALDYRSNGYGGANGYTSGTAAALSLDTFHQQQQQQHRIQQQQQQKLFTQSCPVSAQHHQPQPQPQSHHQQQNRFAFGAYDSMAQQQPQAQAPQAHNAAGNGFPRSEPLITDDWLNDLLASATNNNNSSNNNSSNNNNGYSAAHLDYLAGAIGPAGCGLSSTNSTSQDEGLGGDSPISSLSKQQGEMFGHSYISSIWSTPADHVLIGQRDKLATAAQTPQQQFATA